MLFLCQGTNYFKNLVDKSTVYANFTGGKVELDTLKGMNFVKVQEQGFIPLYKRDSITDDFVCSYLSYKFLHTFQNETIQDSRSLHVFGLNLLYKLRMLRNLGLLCLNDMHGNLLSLDVPYTH